MSNLEFEYHLLVDSSIDAARSGDSALALHLGDLAEAVHEAAMLKGLLPASSYREGYATEIALGLDSTITN
jgi:hypothetical protein